MLFCHFDVSHNDQWMTMGDISETECKQKVREIDNSTYTFLIYMVSHIYLGSLEYWLI